MRTNEFQGASITGYFPYCKGYFNPIVTFYAMIRVRKCGLIDTSQLKEGLAPKSKPKMNKAGFKR